MAKPEISLSDLIFLLHVNSTAYVKRGDQIELGSSDRFHVQVKDLSHLGVSKSSMNTVTLMCDVVYKDDWEDDLVRIFDDRMSLNTNCGWMINALDTPHGYNQGLLADVKVSFNGELLDKIGFQLLPEYEGDHLSTDDALRYLQSFFHLEN